MGCDQEISFSKVGDFYAGTRATHMGCDKVSKRAS